MNSFLIITAIVGLAAGDVSHLQGQSGYHYQVPHTSYGVPSHQAPAPAHTGGNYKGYQQTQQAQQAHQVQQGTSFGQQGPSYAQQANQGYQNANQYQSSGLSVAQAPSAGYHYAGGQQGSHYQAANQYQTGQQYQAAGQQYQSSVVQKYQEYSRQQQQPTQVFKHFYVHAAPEEPEQPKFRQPVVLPPPQKHYKVIFIKTPAQSALQPQVVPVQQQNEEKTIVYVLVPKQEEARDVVIPKVEQKPPVKPEVYFIKYQGKEGSQAVINNIVNDYNKGEAGSVQYSGADGASALSDASGAFVQSSFGQSESQLGSAGQQEFIHQVPQYFSSEGQGIKSATAEAVSGGYQDVAESSAVVQSGVTSSEAQNQQSFNTVSTSQGVPHENYGPPKFRSL